MVNYLEGIDHGLMLEEPKMVIPWSLREENVLKWIDGAVQITDHYYALGNVKLSGLPFVDCIGLCFIKGKLAEIYLGMSREDYSEEKIDSIFDEHQAVLKKIFGWGYRKILKEIFFHDMDMVEYAWRFRYITITHTLWEHFGKEENLTIHIKRRRI